MAFQKLSVQAGEASNNITSPPPTFTFEVIFNVLGRSIFASANAYLLYTSLVPDTHIMHSPLVKAFLEFPMFQFLGKLSFGVYMTHFIVVVYVTMIYLPPDRLDIIVGTNIFHHFILSLVCVYGISLCIAYVLHIYIEKPCQKVTNKFRYWFSVNSDDKIKMKGH